MHKATKHYLFHDNTNPTDEISEEDCQFITDMAAGLPINPSFIVDNRIAKLMRYYEILSITDEEMGITVEAIDRDFENIDQRDRSVYGYNCRESTRKGFDGIHINFFDGLCRGMNNPSYIFV